MPHFTVEFCEAPETEQSSPTKEQIELDKNEEKVDDTTYLDLLIVEAPPVTDRGEKKKGRVCRPDQWKQSVRKQKKNLGLEYLRTNGSVEPEKQMGPPCKCKMRCFRRIGDETCSKIFNNFWKLGDYSLQNAYIAGCVRISRPKYLTKKDGNLGKSRRIFSRCFYVTVDGVDTEICKQAFLNVHSISNGRLDRLLKKKRECGNAGIDARGRHANKTNRIADAKIAEVRRSIDDFRRFAGYKRKSQPNVVEIIPAPYNIRTMYRNYCQELESEGKTPVSEFRYRKVLQDDYNIDFAERYLSINGETTKTLESHSTQTVSTNDKIVYTSLDSDGNTYVAFSPDAFDHCNLPTQGWTFTTN